MKLFTGSQKNKFFEKNKTKQWAGDILSTSCWRESYRCVPVNGHPLPVKDSIRFYQMNELMNGWQGKSPGWLKAGRQDGLVGWSQRAWAPEAWGGSRVIGPASSPQTPDSGSDSFEDSAPDSRWWLPLDMTKQVGGVRRRAWQGLPAQRCLLYRFQSLIRQFLSLHTATTCSCPLPQKPRVTPEGALTCHFLLPLPFCSIQVWDRLDSAHLPWEAQIALFGLLIQMLISARNTSQTHPEIMLSQISGHLVSRSNWCIKWTITEVNSGPRTPELWAGQALFWISTHGFQGWHLCVLPESQREEREWGRASPEGQTLRLSSDSALRQLGGGPGFFQLWNALLCFHRFFAVDENVNWYSHKGEQYEGSFKT